MSQCMDETQISKAWSVVINGDLRCVHVYRLQIKHAVQTIDVIPLHMSQLPTTAKLPYAPSMH